MLQIRWYALAYLAGLFLGWWLCASLAQRAPKNIIKAQHFGDFLGWAALGIVLGGRLGYCLLYQPDYYLNNLIEILYIWKGGMAFHGGFLGFGLATWFYARTHKLPFMQLADYLAIAAPIGLFFGRLANFINAELYGRASDVPWAVVFPIPYAEQSLYPMIPRHPSQLYEALLEGLLLFALLYVSHQNLNLRKYPGLITGLFMAGYGSMRFFVEFFRQYDVLLPLIGGWMTHGQLYSLPLIAAGLGLSFYSLYKK